MCHFVVEQVFSGAFEEAMRWCACIVMKAGYCWLVHGRVCSVQRILPRSKCASMQDEAQLHVRKSIGTWQLQRCALNGGWEEGKWE